MNSAHAKPKEGRVYGLDLLRAAAILCVTFSHGYLAPTLRQTFGQGLPFLQRFMRWINFTDHFGALGVEIFFVLSGFLIGRILLRSAGNFGFGEIKVFFLRRWFRTLPLFWLFVVLNVAFEMALHSSHFTLRDILGVTFFLRNFFTPTLPFFPESWSLAVEEWFYVIFPILLLIAFRIRKKDPLRVFLVVAIAVFLAALALRCVSATKPGVDWVNVQRCSVFLRLDAIMTGVIAAWIERCFPERWSRAPKRLAAVGLLVFLLGYGTIWNLATPDFSFSADGFYAKTFRFNVISCGVALMLPAASLWKVRRERFYHGWIHAIAVWSYAMYLLNWPLFQILMQPWANRFHTHWWSEDLFFVAKQAILIGCCAAIYRFYERPITRLREKWS